MSTENKSLGSDVKYKEKDAFDWKPSMPSEATLANLSSGTVDSDGQIQRPDRCGSAFTGRTGFNWKPSLPSDEWMAKYATYGRKCHKTSSPDCRTSSETTPVASDSAVSDSVTAASNGPPFPTDDQLEEFVFLISSEPFE